MTHFNRFSRVFLTAIVLLALAQHYSCKNGGVTPPDEGCPPPPKLDSTSHNFIWRLDTLGDGNGSTLNDVFIINDTLAYAVGEIYLKDSTGQFDQKAYNVARWDGSKWNLQRILVRDFGTLTGYFPLKAVFAFSPTDVWFASDADLIQWNGSTSSSKAFFMTSIPFNGQVLRLWGTTASNLYCVGRSGAVYLYNGSSWQKLASPTTIDILDIWGGTNCKGELEILSVASNGASVPQAKALLTISGTAVTKVNDAGLPLSIAGVWFVASQKYFVGGDGFFSTAAIGSNWTQENLPFYYTAKIKGLGLNDIVWVGGYGFISHYNGSSWHHYTGVELPYIDGNYYGVSLHRRLVIAVGIVGQGQGIALVGRR